MLRLFLVSLLLIAASGAAVSQVVPLRIATYNLLNFPGASGAARLGSFRTVVAAMRPHVLVAQEVLDAQGVSIFRDQVLRPALGPEWSSAPFVDAGTDSENAFFFDTSRVSLVSTEVVSTPLRAIAGYRFAVFGTTDTVWIYSLHLKAAQEESERRRIEASRLREHLDSARSGEMFIVAGDFNIYGASEPAFQLLLAEGANSQSRVIDPINSVAEWHTNRSLAWTHTQSPRVRSFQGGSNGGMDDRFDLILVSTALAQQVISSSYTALGNDGQHFNDSLNRPPNMAVPDSVAQAIHDASDHLPVFADFLFGESARVAASRTSPVIAVAPNPFSTSVTFAFSGAGHAELVIRDQQGRIVTSFRPDPAASVVQWNPTDVPSGVYHYTVGGQTGTLVHVR